MEANKLEMIVFLTNSAGTHKKLNLDAVFTSYPNIISKWIMKLNVKIQNYKTSRKKTRKKNKKTRRKYA